MKIEDTMYMKSFVLKKMYQEHIFKIIHPKNALNM